MTLTGPLWALSAFPSPKQARAANCLPVKIGSKNHLNLPCFSVWNALPKSTAAKTHAGRKAPLTGDTRHSVEVRVRLGSRIRFSAPIHRAPTPRREQSPAAFVSGSP
jgi:hypothetical protein